MHGESFRAFRGADVQSFAQVAHEAGKWDGAPAANGRKLAAQALHASHRKLFFFPHHPFETNLGSSERAAAFSMACLCCAPTHVEQLDQVPLGTYWIRCML